MAISNLEIALQKAIKVIEKTFVDECLLYTYDKVVLNGITRTKLKQFYKGKCRLCINNVIQPMESGVYFSTGNKYVVMLPIDVDVPLNSVLEVSTNNQTLKFNCGYSFKLRTYQQISVTLYDGVA